MSDDRKVVKVKVEPGLTTTFYDDGTVDWDLFDMPDILVDMIEQVAKEQAVSFSEAAIGLLEKAMETSKRRGHGGDQN